MAQSRLTGRVLADDNNFDIIGAHVILKDEIAHDSSLVIADSLGYFLFDNIYHQRTYVLMISALGFNSYLRNITFDSTSANLDDVHLIPSVAYLKELEIKDKADPIQQSGDTIIFNTAGYKTNADAVARDLIKKIPGITSSGGKVQAQGEEVKQILVDGRQFFGKGLDLALDNLPVSTIQNVQVFDQQSEQSQHTGFDDGKSLKTINFVTKQQIQNSQFGTVSAGYGLDKKYIVGGSMNIFKDKERLSIIGNSNNINQQQLADGGESDKSGRVGGMSNTQKGISSINKIGATAFKEYKYMSFDASYFYDYLKTENLEDIDRNYYNPNNDIVRYREETAFTNSNRVHNFNARLDYNSPSRNSFTFTPELRLNGLGVNNLLNGSSLNQNDILVSEISRDQDLVDDQFGFSGGLIFNHQFSKPRRSVTISFRPEMYRTDKQQVIGITSPILGRTELISNSGDNRRNIVEGTEYQMNAEIIYVEPINKRGLLKLSHALIGNEYQSKNYTYNIGESGQESLDALLTNIYQLNQVTQEVGLFYQNRSRKSNFTIGSNYQFRNLKGKLILPDPGSVSNSYRRLLPEASFSLRVKPHKRLYLNYKAQTNVPSINQLQNVINYQNPLSFYSGNPNLKQDYSHVLLFRYNGAKVEKGSSLSLFNITTYVQDFIGNGTIIVSSDSISDQGLLIRQGAELRKPINFDRSWNNRTEVTYGFPVPFVKSNLNLNASVSYRQLPGFINGAKSYSNLFIFGSGFVLASNVSESIDFTIAPSFNYYHENNALQNTLNSNYWFSSLTSQLNLRFARSFILRGSVSYSRYSGFGNNEKIDYLLMNWNLGKKVFKSQLGEIRLSIYDVLNENQGIFYNLTATYSESQRNISLRRFVTLSFHYRLRRFYNTKKD